MGRCRTSTVSSDEPSSTTTTRYPEASKRSTVVLTAFPSLKAGTITITMHPGSIIRPDYCISRLAPATAFLAMSPVGGLPLLAAQLAADAGGDIELPLAAHH